MVFASEMGAQLYGGHVTRSFQATLKQAELPRFRFHDLRHGAATLQLSGTTSSAPATATTTSPRARANAVTVEVGQIPLSVNFETGRNQADGGAVPGVSVGSQSVQSECANDTL